MTNRSLRILAVLLSFAAILSSPSWAAPVFPGASWSQRTPGEVGLDEAKLQQLAGQVGGWGMIVRDGYQVYTWGNVAASVNWASASKPALTTLLFIAKERGLADTDSQIGSFMSGGTASDRAITLFQLSNMMSGYSRGEAADAAWAYNDYGINLYGHVICNQIFGATPSNVFSQEFGFLQFQDAVGVSNTQYGRITQMSVRDFARFGHFWLNRGNWNGTQHIPSSTFDLITNHVPTSLPLTSQDGAESWSLGSFGGTDNQNPVGPGHYGMTFWVNTNGFFGPGTPANMFEADGHWGGEVCFVFPDLNLVAVGKGNWGHPATQAVNLILEADQNVAIETSSWASIKDQYRTGSSTP